MVGTLQSQAGIAPAWDRADSPLGSGSPAEGEVLDASNHRQKAALRLVLERRHRQLPRHHATGLSQHRATPSSSVDVSFLVQYFCGRGRTARHARLASRFVRTLRESAEASGVSHEVLVNVDSPDVRDGDLAVLVPAVGPSGRVLLASNVGETRAYNNLARMARGTHLVLLQDDMQLRPGTGGWLRRSLGLFGSQAAARRPLGLLGFSEGVCCVECPTATHPHEVTRPRCVEPGTAEPAEAVACATMGPMMLARGLFLALGGFNESLSARGAPSTLLDCELSARVWLAGRAVFIAPPLVNPSAAEAHVAWRAPGIAAADGVRCAWVRSAFYSARVLPALAASVRVTNARQLDCSAAAAAKDATASGGCPLPTACSALPACADCTGRGVHRRRDRLANVSAALLPPADPALAVDISFLMQYWAGGRDGASKPQSAAGTLLSLLAAAAAAGVSSEVLVNDDSSVSSHTSHTSLSREAAAATDRPAAKGSASPAKGGPVGDAARLMRSAGPNGAVLLSPNVHELRGYNSLARLARGAVLIFLQDDDSPPAARPPHGPAWLVTPLQLLRRHARAGSVSIKGGLFFVSEYDEHVVGVQRIDDLPGWYPRCAERGSRARVEAARCVDVGPLFVRRSQFLQIGGFNESGVPRGEPGSVRVDCEMEARMALGLGLAPLALGLAPADRWAYGRTHVAWDHPKMEEGHKWRMLDYRQRYELPRSAPRLAIERACRDLNGEFDCPVAEIARKPANKLDCAVVEAPGTCEV